VNRIVLDKNWHCLPVKSKDDWRQKPLAEAGYFKTQLPGPWQLISGLEKHYGTVIYRNRFNLSLPKHHYATLILDKACYQTRVNLNGQWVGRPEAGYFQKRYIAFENNIEKENTLHIEVSCEREKDLTAKRQVLGIFSHWDMLPRSLNPGGLHALPEIRVHGPILPVGLRCFAENMDDDTAHIVGEIDLVSISKMSTWITVVVEPLNCTAPSAKIEMPYQLKKGENTRIFSLHLKGLKKWWPKALGSPNLYRVVARVNPESGPSEVIEEQVGFRTVEMEDLNLKINGVPLFLRGANMAPVAPYLSEMNDEKIIEVLDDAEALNLNLVRVHSHVSPKKLYNEADKRGLLVWQDMPLQWLYHPKIMPEIRRQGRRLMKYVFNHPSVVIFCCANEPIYMEDTGKLKFKQTVLTLWNYFGPSHMRDVIAKGLWRDLSKKDPNRIYIQSSGELETPIAEGSDTHLYPGWYAAFGPVERFDWYAAKMPKNIRFVSEFGAQSFPNVETSRSMLSENLDKENWPQIVSKRFAQISNLRHWIDFDACHTLADLVEVTQSHQARVSRYMIDRLRHHKYEPTGGFTHFLLNEPMVGVTWSLVDAHGVKKKSFETVAHCLEPANLYLLPGEIRVDVDTVLSMSIYGVNDRPDDVTLRWNARVLPNNEEAALQKSGEVVLPGDAARVKVDHLRYRPLEEGFFNVIIQINKIEGATSVKFWEHRYRIEVCGPQRRHVGKRRPQF
jgi:beta-mannosidase